MDKSNILISKLSFLIGLILCCGVPAQTETKTPVHYAELQLRFGMSIPGTDNRNEVAVSAWQHFVETVIAKHFSGFSIVDAVGYYQGQAERSKIVSVLYESKDSASVNAAAVVIARDFAMRFGQDSVIVANQVIQHCEFVIRSNSTAHYQQQACAF